MTATMGRRPAVRTHLVAIATTLLLAAALLTTAPPVVHRAAAAPGALTLQWSVSTNFQTVLLNRAVSGGVSSQCRGATAFGGGTGTYHPGSGAASVGHPGSVTADDGRMSLGALCLLPKPPTISLTIADLKVIVDVTGAGRLTAVVSSSDTGGASIGPKRVPVARFTVEPSSWTNNAGVGTLTVTPARWTPAFLNRLTPGVRAHFAPDPGDNAQQAAAKRPAPITATADERTVTEPTLETRVLDASRGGGLTLHVQGLGYPPEPFSNGTVSVAVAKAGGRIGYLRQLHRVLITRSAMRRDAFATTLTVPARLLDPRVRHAVYTYAGALQETGTLDAESRFGVPARRLGYPLGSKVRVKVGRAPRTGRAGKVQVRVTGPRFTPSGKVRLVWHKGKTRRSWTTRLNKRGRVAQRLPVNSKGQWTLRVRYGGTKAHRASTRTVRIRAR